jgi:Ser-tRNA(Ala) deacylase AlaX
MGTDARKTGDRGSVDLELESQIEEILEEQLMGLESKVRAQLEEKTLHWVEEECKKRLETIQASIREEIQREVENWIEGELRRRMEEFKKRNENI